MISERKAARALQRVNQQPDLLEGKYFGRITYAAAWAQMRSRNLSRWLLDTSQGRRWQPSNGEEWQLLHHCISFTEAHHVTRVLCNGLPGSARRRGDDERRPH
eukprot:6325343-Pyramimonas_sp.AAC.1